MNLVLLEPSELEGSRARVGGRRAKHIATVHRAVVGKRLRVGVVDGMIGSGEVLSVSADEVLLDVELTAAAPPPLPCTLALALPRPKVLRRVLAAASAFGVKRIVVFGANRVEKSYWQSPMLADNVLREELVVGLEQGGDTVMPVVEMQRRFRPFVEDRLAQLAAGTLALVAHPGGSEACPCGVGQAVTLVVGPEGGFIDFELELMREAGLVRVSLGSRPLRVEHAVAALLGRLF